MCLMPRLLSTVGKMLLTLNFSVFVLKIMNRLTVLLELCEIQGHEYTGVTQMHLSY